MSSKLQDLLREELSAMTENESVKMGHRYGLIRFGSRVDVYFPKNFNILVKRTNFNFWGNYFSRL